MQVTKLYENKIEKVWGEDVIFWCVFSAAISGVSLASLMVVPLKPHFLQLPACPLNYVGV